MVKLIGLLKKKTGMSKGDFRAYYESRHVPLVKRLLPAGEEYRRNYPNLIRVDGKEVVGEPEFDVISEMSFSSQAGYEAFAEAMQNPELRAQIVTDEEQFLDRSSTRILMVEVHS